MLARGAVTVVLCLLAGCTARPSHPPIANGVVPGIGESGDAGTDAPGGIPGAYQIATYAPPTKWTQVRAIAANSKEQLFVTDGSTVFMVENGAVTTYLGAEISALLDGGAPGIAQLDVGPDDKLYMLSAGTTTSSAILVSDGPQSVAVHRALDGADVRPFMSVIAPDRIIVLKYLDGLYEVSAAGSKKVVENSVIGGSDCAMEAMMTTYDGHLFYDPGCNGSAIVGGPLDGSGIGVLVKTDFLGVYGNFEGIGRYPGGGAVIGTDGLPGFIKVENDGSHAFFTTYPTIGDMNKSGAFGSTQLGLYGALIAVSPNGVIYFAVQGTVFRASPP